MTSALNHTIDCSSSLLVKLINRGDEVAIVKGKLFIKPYSALAVPHDWLIQNRALLINEIGQLFNKEPLQYISFTTGSYGTKKYQGVTLQFRSLLSGEFAYLIFNANLKRSRKSKNANKGEPLPGKQFIVSERSSFYKFWLSTGLALPKSLSKFYECMGKLKSLTFKSEIDSNNRIKDKTLPLLEVNYHEILNKLKQPRNVQLNENKPAKQPLEIHQGTSKKPLSLAAKETELELTSKGLKPNQSACVENHGYKFIRKEVIRQGTNADRSTLNSDKLHRAQKSNFEHVAKSKRPEDQTVDEWLTDWEAAFTGEEFAELMADFDVK
ncbi:hypothetical protein Q4575_10655 [Psychrosphaera sp. 1_MG-2023]|uniref:hypothetical protein n=1 Tax=Psychrosphaera sp. 1_MG-2023 TaxID=3062643 RepID=UPI0026E1878B|nr:hypothetical protein [Psychrosphaera sp. 1_MG-2023]MDO6719865.1 hypothetical protein [Psychrosphaera sp. 1_MG-2023]